MTEEGVLVTREGTRIPIESGERSRLEWWRTQTKSVPAEVLRELGWLTPDRKVMIQTQNGAEETTGDKVDSDVLFLRPADEDEETKRTWAFILEMGHRMVLSRRLAKDHAERCAKQIAEVRTGLESARRALREKRAEVGRKLWSLQLRAKKTHDEGHRTELAARAELPDGNRGKGATAVRALTAKVELMRAIRQQIHELESSPLAEEQAVAAMERRISELESQRREWLVWERPRNLPGLMGWASAFLTRQQMNVGNRAVRELSRPQIIAREGMGSMRDRLDRDVPVGR